MDYNNIDEPKTEIEHGLIAGSSVLSAVSTFIILYTFSQNGFNNLKSEDYSNVLKKNVLVASLILSVVALLLSLSVFFIKQASSYIKVGCAYLAILSLVSCVVLGIMINKKPLSKGVQISVILLNIPMIIAIVVAGGLFLMNR